MNADKCRFQAGLLAAFALCAQSSTVSYKNEIEKWRVEREAKLKAEDGYLAVSGLFWLREGENRVGSDPSSEVPLPAGAAPERVGVVELKQGRVTLADP
jgi:hypothetical protein